MNNNEKINQAHSQKKKSTLTFILMIVVLVVLLLASQVLNWGTTPTIIIVLVVLFGISFIHGSHAKKAKDNINEVTEALAEEVVHEILPSMEYHMKDMLPQELTDTEMGYNVFSERFYGGDLLKGTYKDQHFELCHITRKRVVRNSDGPDREAIVFSGLGFVTKMNRSLNGNVLVSARTKLSKKFQKTAVPTGREDFDQAFAVRADNEYDHSSFLDNKMMDNILQLKNLNKGDIYLKFFEDGTIYLEIDHGPSIFYVNNLKKKEEEIKADFKEDAIMLAKIMDILKDMSI